MDLAIGPIKVFTEKQRIDYLESLIANEGSEVTIIFDSGNVLISASSGVMANGPTLRDAISNGLKNING